MGPPCSRGGPVPVGGLSHSPRTASPRSPAGGSHPAPPTLRFAVALLACFASPWLPSLRLRVLWLRGIGFGPPWAVALVEVCGIGGCSSWPVCSSMAPGVPGQPAGGSRIRCGGAHPGRPPSARKGGAPSAPVGPHWPGRAALRRPPSAPVGPEGRRPVGPRRPGRAAPRRPPLARKGGAPSAPVGPEGRRPVGTVEGRLVCFCGACLVVGGASRPGGVQSRAKGGTTRSRRAAGRGRGARAAVRVGALGIRPAWRPSEAGCTTWTLQRRTVRPVLPGRRPALTGRGTGLLALPSRVAVAGRGQVWSGVPGLEQVRGDRQQQHRPAGEDP